MLYFDAKTGQPLRKYKFEESNACISNLDFNPKHDQVFASGQMNGDVFIHDLRQRDDFSDWLRGHEKLTIGTKWSLDGDLLATSDNQGKILLWDPRKSDTSSFAFLHWESGVKGLDWNPHQRGVLASGGGVRDCFIWVWDTLKFSEI